MGLLYLIVVLILAALTFIYFFIIKYKPTHVSITDGNLKLYKQQISDFKKDHSMGYVNVDEFQNINDELSRRILKLNFSSAEEEFNEDKNFIFFYRLIIPIVLALAIIIYGINGKPNMPDFSASSRIDNTIPEIYWELTLSDIEKKINKFPEDIESYLNKAGILSTLGREQESFKVWEKIILLSGDNIDPKNLLNYGEFIVNQNIKQKSEYIISEKAFKVFQKVSYLTPVNTEVGALSRYYLSIAVLEKGDMEKAYALWQEIKEKAPKEADWRESILLQIAKLEEKYSISKNKQILAMVDKLEKRLLDNNSKEIGDWKKLGKSSLVLGQLERAEKAYRKAFELNSDDLESIIGLAESRLFQNDKNKNIDVETLDLFKKIHTINKDYSLALWVLSEDEISKGNKQEAVILLKKLLASLTQGDEEYIFIFNKIEELEN
jgi:cytochrome c-type biogenesis protein CcmI